MLLLVNVAAVAQKKLPPANGKIKPAPSAGPQKKDYSYLAAAIELTAPETVYQPRNFYIESVIDHTNTGDSAGNIVMPQSFQLKKIPFQKAKDRLLLDFFSATIKKDTQLIPVVIEINKLEVREQKLTPAMVGNSMEIRLKASTKIDNEKVTVYEFSRGGQGEWYIYSKRKYDSLIVNALSELPEALDTLAGQMIANHPAFAQGIRHRVSMATGLHPDSLFLTANSFLTLEDYMGVSKDESDFYSAFGLFLDNGYGEYKDRHLNVELRIVPVFIRSRSWMGDKLKKAAIIRHETYRGLLLYLYALKLREKLEQGSYSVNGFRDEVHLIYSNLQDEMIEEARKYGKETQYGLKSKEQTAWQNRIEEQLRLLSRAQ